MAVRHQRVGDVADALFEIKDYGHGISLELDCKSEFNQLLERFTVVQNLKK